MATKSNTVKKTEQAIKAPTQPPLARDALIHCRAYEIFRARGINGKAGDALADWLQAEREVCELGRADRSNQGQGRA